MLILFFQSKYFWPVQIFLPLVFPQAHTRRVWTSWTAGPARRCSPCRGCPPTSSTRRCTWRGSSPTRRSPSAPPPSPAQTRLSPHRQTTKVWHGFLSKYIILLYVVNCRWCFHLSHIYISTNLKISRRYGSICICSVSPVYNCSPPDHGSAWEMFLIILRPLLTGDGPVCCVDMITRLPQFLHWYYIHLPSIYIQGVLKRAECSKSL